MTRTCLPAALAVVILSSCAAGGESTGEHARSIVGGSTDAAHPAVGALTGKYLCSGALISPRLVLTAAHCFKNGRTYDYFKIGADIYSPDREVAIAACAQHPDFGSAVIEQTNVPIHDIAVCILATAVTGVAPVLLHASTLKDAEGTPVTFVGYGATDGAGDGLGTRRRVTVPVDTVHPFGFFNRVGAGPVMNTCNGDSGGPGFVSEGGVERVAGVVSAGDADCTALGWNTRVDMHVGWILSVAAQEDPGAIDLGMCGDGACAGGVDTPKNCPFDCGDIDMPDAGADAGATVDSGTAADGGAVADAGVTPPDVGVDAGRPADAGAASDAGGGAGKTTDNAGGEGGGEESGGCSVAGGLQPADRLVDIAILAAACALLARRLRR